MAILKVARLGHPVLREKSLPVPIDEIRSPEIQRLIEDLVETNPGDIQFQRGLAWCENDIGNALSEEGKTSNALAAYERSRQTKQRIAEEHPGDADGESTQADPKGLRDLGAIFDRITQDGDVAHREGDPGILPCLGNLKGGMQDEIEVRVTNRRQRLLAADDVPAARRCAAGSS